MSVAERRVRRAEDKDGVLRQLVDDGPFQAFRDVLVFAAALGYYNDRREPLGKTGEAIRWDVLVNRRGTETLVNMLGAVASTAGPEVLAEERFDERIAIFEEYANGGLEILRSELARSAGSPSDVVSKLVREALAAQEDDTVPQLDKLVDEIGF